MLSGRDVKHFAADLLRHLRDLLVANTVKDIREMLDLSDETLHRLQVQAKEISAEELIEWIRIFSNLQNDLRYAANERLVLEVTLLELCANSGTAQDLTGLLARIAGLERKMEEGISFVAQAPAVSKQTKKDTAPPKPKKKPPALEGDRKKVVEQWPLLRAELSDSVLKGILSQVELGFMEDEYLYLICEYDTLQELVKPHLETIDLFLQQKIGKSFLLQTTTKYAYEKWYHATYAAEEEAKDDADFSSLLGSYFSDAEYE